MSKDQGLSLLDIAPAFELVPVGDDQNLRVIGVSAEGVVALFKRFPEMGKWFAGGLKPEIMTKAAPEAIAAIIAAGCGTPGNEGAEEVARALPVETQLDVLEAIGRLTFKKGFGPFVDRIIALTAAAKSANYGRAKDMASQPQSKPSQPSTAETTAPSGN
jgi:hypothetical protein